MSADLRRLLAAFAGLHVTIIGEAMLDSYLEGTATRLAQEAPVPAVTLSGRTDAPGGAANAAANIASMGGQVRFLSVTGDDHEGDLLERSLAAAGVPADDLVVQRGRRTLAKQRVVADGQMLVRFDQGDTDPIDRQSEAILIGRLQDAFVASDAMIVADYGYGVLTAAVRRALIQLQARSPRPIVVDAKDLDAYRGLRATVVKPNYDQAARLLNIQQPVTRQERAAVMAAYGERILDLTGARIAAVTLDADGALIFERNRPAYRTYAVAGRSSRTAGAGDTFGAAFALAIAAGAHAPGAAELASAAAGVVVGKDGTSCCSAQELDAVLSGGERFSASLEALATQVELYRRQGRRVVFTNGCFDILHRGHITYLNQAKRLGDVLIVGLNTDESVRRLKGESRPINNLEDRAQVLAALSCIDHIAGFAEDTPMRLIHAIRPDVYVKGGDYTREMLPEAPVVQALGGVVRILPYVEDRSTSGMIERIRAEAMQPAAGLQRGAISTDRAAPAGGAAGGDFAGGDFAGGDFSGELC